MAMVGRPPHRTRVESLVAACVVLLEAVNLVGVAEEELAHAVHFLRLVLLELELQPLKPYTRAELEERAYIITCRHAHAGSGVVKRQSEWCTVELAPREI